MSIYAGVGISSKKNSTSAVFEAIYQAKENLDSKEVSLAVVFTSFEFASPDLLELIVKGIGTDIPLIGATSNAILTQNGLINAGIAITLINTEKPYFNIGAVKNVAANLFSGGETLGKQLLLGMEDVPRRFCMLFSDGQLIDNLPFLNGLQQKLGHSFPIIGATTASDDIHLNQTRQYFNQEVLSNSVVGLLWSGKVNFGLGVKHGWNPIGKPHRVNTSDKFIIKAIEGKPAVALYQDYFAKDIEALQKELKRISCLYPIGINISGEEEYLLRNILSIRDDGALICRGDVPTDSRIRLMIGAKESCLAATEEAAKQAKHTLALQMFPKKEPAGIIFVFYSASRAQVLGRKQITKELEVIKSLFPEIPIVGLCTYGEQAPLKATDFAGKTYCHNQTVTILAMK